MGAGGFGVGAGTAGVLAALLMSVGGREVPLTSFSLRRKNPPLDNLGFPSLMALRPDVSSLGTEAMGADGAGGISAETAGEGTSSSIIVGGGKAPSQSFNPGPLASSSCTSVSSWFLASRAEVPSVRLWKLGAVGIGRVGPDSDPLEVSKSAEV